MTATLVADRDMALAESLLYDVLSRTLREPDVAGWAHLVEVQGPALAGIEARDVGLARDLDDVHRAITRTSFTDAQAACREFFPPVETPDCPTYESAYRGDDAWSQADLMADVSGFYRAHGLRVGRARRERPDHIGVELEFMSVVARQEAAAIEHDAVDQARLCRESGDAFLRDHLGCWGIALGERVARLATADYLRAGGRLLASWITSELSARSLEPLERVGGPKRQAFEVPPGDDLDMECGPGSSDPSLIPVSSLVKGGSPGS